jgi:hypothetical protein
MPHIPIRTALVVGGLLLLGACGHSEPFTASDTRLTEPLDATPPVQLTYAGGANTRPAFSEDGAALTYGFVRGTPDRDRCLATLPATGGTRTRSLCWTAQGQDTLADGLELGALAADGRLAFTRHTSRVNGIIANDAGLYITRGGEAVDAERVLDLFVFQPAGGTAWDYLLDLTWSGSNELTALATDAVVINRCPPATCWDTTYVGLHVATIQPGSGAAPSVVTAVPVEAAAAGVAVDRSTGRRFIRYPDRIEELLPNGTTTLAWTMPRPAGQVAHRITGLAAANGRLVVSTAYTDVPPPPAQSTAVSQLRRIDGGDQLLGVRLGAEGSFGAVTLDPTGRRLAFEGRTGASRQLFLLELP